MQKNIQALIFATLASCITVTVQADPCTSPCSYVYPCASPGTYAGSNPYSFFNVTVPNQQGGFTAGIDALYLRGTASNLGYSSSAGIGYEYPDSTSVTLGNTESIQTTYQWGFDATVGYRFPGTGNDLTATWTHLGNFRNTDQNTVFTERTIEEEPPASYFNQAGSVNFDYNSVALDLDQQVDFDNYFLFKMFAGAQWTDLDETLNESYSKTPITDTSSTTTIVSQYDDSDFKGVGPQIGFSGHAYIGYGFGIDAGVTGSLLTGYTDTNASMDELTSLHGRLVASVSSSLDNDKNTNDVLPALNANAGLDYTYAFANPDRSFVTIQGGYEVINYYNVTQKLTAHVLPNGTFPIDSAVNSLTISSGNGAEIAFNGPYVGVTATL